MNERQLMYKTLDNPIRILFWSVDEFLLLAGPLFLSMCLGSISLIFIGFILKPFYTKIKKQLPYGAFKHMLYWNLPTSTLRRMGRIKSLPPSHCRELLL